jgi:hypothetical protein
VAFSDYERFKWESMEHLAHRTGLGGPWYEVKRLTSDPVEQAALVQRLVLELFDEGFVFGTYAKYRDAYNLKWHEFTPVPREVVERELTSAEDDEPVEGDPEAIERFWIFPTLEGERASLSQPAEAFFSEYSPEDIEKRRGLIARLDD